MKKLLLSGLLLLGVTAVNAQQDPQFTHYMYDRLSVNPGVAGTANAICATGIFRQQWSGFDGAPQTFLLNAHMPVNVLRGGLGITFFNDQLGQETNNIARLSYSFHRALGPGTLGIGIQGGIINKTLGSDWQPPDGAASIPLDNAIPGAGASHTTYDLGFGLYYTSPQMWIGLSATHLPQQDLKLATLDFEMVRHYFVMAGYRHDFNAQWALRPSVYAKSDAASTQIDINANVLWNNMVWLGVSYRLSDAIAPMAGFQTEVGQGLMKIGYSYDVTTSDIKNYSSGSHEIMLNYCFNVEPPEKDRKYKNVRFL